MIRVILSLNIHPLLLPGRVRVEPAVQPRPDVPARHLRERLRLQQRLQRRRALQAVHQRQVQGRLQGRLRPQLALQPVGAVRVPRGLRGRPHRQGGLRPHPLRLHHARKLPQGHAVLQRVLRKIYVY